MEKALTGTHQVMGTLRYMAPEQMEGTHSVDHRADIYSLGVVIYEMLTGELPSGNFAPPSRSTPIDQRLDDVVQRSLEKEPERRYQQAGELGSDVSFISDAQIKVECQADLIQPGRRSENDSFLRQLVSR